MMKYLEGKYTLIHIMLIYTFHCLPCGGDRGDPARKTLSFIHLPASKIDLMSKVITL